MQSFQIFTDLFFFFFSGIKQPFWYKSSCIFFIFFSCHSNRHKGALLFIKFFLWERRWREQGSKLNNREFSEVSQIFKYLNQKFSFYPTKTKLCLTKWGKAQPQPLFLARAGGEATLAKGKGDKLFFLDNNEKNKMK